MDIAAQRCCSPRGFGGGIAAAIAGGASLVTFPTLLAMGLPPVAANATNAVGLSLSNFMAAVADWRRRPSWGRSLSWLFVDQRRRRRDRRVPDAGDAGRSADPAGAGPDRRRDLAVRDRSLDPAPPAEQRRWRAAHGAGGVSDLPVFDLWRLFRRGARRHQPGDPGDRRLDRPAQHQRAEEHPHHRRQRCRRSGSMSGRARWCGRRWWR